MSDVRYQVFISSTFADLQAERREVFHAVQSLDCIPSGMELFPASNEEQFNFITRVIDDCDFYIVILAGRYGSVTDEGVSFTEKEFDYALSKGVPVLAFLHNDTGSIAFARSEQKEDGRAKLAAFRERVETGRLVKYWTTPADLAGRVATSLASAIRESDRPGWVRGPKFDEVPLLKQVNALQAENLELKRKLSLVQPSIGSRPLAHGDESFEVEMKQQNLVPTKLRATWNQILVHIGPVLTYRAASEPVIKRTLGAGLVAQHGIRVLNAEVKDACFEIIRLQLEALGLIDIRATPANMFWQLTSKGKSQFAVLQTVKSAKDVERS